jgi:hypothetical protein
MKDLAQEIAQVGNPFEKDGKYADNDRVLFKRVHIVIDCNLDKKFRLLLPRAYAGKTALSS